MGTESGGPSLDYKYLRTLSWYRKFRVVPGIGYLLTIVLSAVHAYGRLEAGSFDWGSFIVLSIIGIGLFYCLKFAVVTFKVGEKAYVAPWKNRTH